MCIRKQQTKILSEETGVKDSALCGNSVGQKRKRYIREWRKGIGVAELGMSVCGGQGGLTGKGSSAVTLKEAGLGPGHIWRGAGGQKEL